MQFASFCSFFLYHELNLCASSRSNTMSRIQIAFGSQPAESRIAPRVPTSIIDDRDISPKKCPMSTITRAWGKETKLSYLVLKPLIEEMSHVPHVDLR